MKSGSEWDRKGFCFINEGTDLFSKLPVAKLCFMCCYLHRYGKEVCRIALTRGGIPTL